MKKFITNALSLIFWILIWQLVYNMVDAKFLFASPFNVLINLINLLSEKETYILILYSALRILAGFLLAVIIGCLLGTLSYLNGIVSKLIGMLINIVKVTPVVSFIILALVYMPSKIVVTCISFLMVLPVFYYTTITSLKSADKNVLEMANMYNFKWYDKIKYIYINGAKKNFISAIETGIGYAFKSGITAEVLVLPGLSLGEMIYNSKIYLDALNLISYTIILILLSILLEKMIVFLAEKVMNYE